MMEERAKQQGYRNGLQTREGRGLGSVWKSLTAHIGLKRKDPCCLRCTAGAVVQAGTPHLSVTSVNVISRMCVLWNRWSWEPASPSAGKHATGVQRARKAVVEGEAGQRRAVKRPRTATARFPPCCSRKALDVRISLTNVTSAGKQTSQSWSGAPTPSRAGPGSLTTATKGQSRTAAPVRCQLRPPLPLPGSSWARRSFLRASSCARPSRISKTVSPWASSST